jgi:hypothetical protein
MLKTLYFDLNIRGLEGLSRDGATDKTSLHAMFLLNS